MHWHEVRVRAIPLRIDGFANRLFSGSVAQAEIHKVLAHLFTTYDMKLKSAEMKTLDLFVLSNPDGIQVEFAKKV